MRFTNGTFGAALAALGFAAWFAGCGTEDASAGVDAAIEVMADETAEAAPSDPAQADGPASDVAAADGAAEETPADAPQEAANDLAPTDSLTVDGMMDNPGDGMMDNPAEGMTDAAAESTETPCGKGAACPAIATADCLALVDNAGMTQFALRMASQTFAKPAALSSGIVKTVLDGNVLLKLPACQLAGNGTFNLLFGFDVGVGKILVGGARPVADPTAGYTFLSDAIAGVLVRPAVADGKPDPTGHFETSPVDLIVPIFMDDAGVQTILLPLKSAVFAGTLSSGHDCIGSASCPAGAPAPTFTPGGTLQAHVTLEDADRSIVAALDESLCVLFGGDATGTNPKVCARDAQHRIVFQGDWCDATNIAGDCGDSMEVSAAFAASAVKVVSGTVGACPTGNGPYCGESPGVNRTAGVLYSCTDGVYAAEQICAGGCQVAPAGQNDSCK